MQKYVDVPRNDMNAEVKNSWFQICRNKSIPFITLKSRAKFADLCWDYITYSPEVEEVLNSSNGQIRDGAIVIFKRYANKKSKYVASDLIVEFKNIDISKARLAAEDLYDFIAAYLEINSSTRHV